MRSRHLVGAVLLLALESSAWIYNTIGLVLPFPPNLFVTPSTISFATYAVNDYSNYRARYPQAGASDLNRSIAAKNVFVNSLRNAILAKYPLTQVSHPINLENGGVTYWNYTSKNSDNSDFVMFAGHGDVGKVVLSDTWASKYDKSFGGKTKWVMMNSCLTLKPDGPSMSPWFNGVHAVLGFHSIEWESIKRRCFLCSGHYRSEDKYEYFAKAFVTEDKPIWDAYLTAIFFTDWVNLDLDEAPAMMFIYGRDRYNFLNDFSKEKYSSTYNGPPPVYDPLNNQVVKYYIEYGTPSY